MLRKTIFVILVVFLFACNHDNKESEILINGQFLYSSNCDIDIINNGKFSRIKINADYCTDYKFFKKGDSILYLYSEYKKSKRFGILAIERLGILDINGKILNNNFYEFNNTKYIYSFAVSNSGKRILYCQKTINRQKKFQNHDIYMVDVVNGIVLDSIKEIPIFSWIWISNSVWSPDESKVVYSFDDHENKNKNGLYIYDLHLKQEILFIPNALCGNWSPDGTSISYILNNSIYLYNVIENTSNQLYSAKRFEYILLGTYWIDNGKYLLFACPTEPFGIWQLGKYKEKIIRIKDNTCFDNNNTIGFYGMVDLKGKVQNME
jgi:hypothetical protein